MMGIEETVVAPQGLDFGPVKVDTNRMVPELSGLAIVMVMMIAFKWAWKRVK